MAGVRGVFRKNNVLRQDGLQKTPGPPKCGGVLILVALVNNGHLYRPLPVQRRFLFLWKLRMLQHGLFKNLPLLMVHSHIFSFGLRPHQKSGLSEVITKSGGRPGSMRFMLWKELYLPESTEIRSAHPVCQAARALT